RAGAGGRPRRDGSRRPGIRKRSTTPRPSRCGIHRRRTAHVVPSGAVTRTAPTRRPDGGPVAVRGGARRVVAPAPRAPPDPADALTGEVEVLADLFEGARLATIEPEAELQDLALALVERSQQAGDLFRQQRSGGDLERRLGRTILDDVAELGVAVFTQR